MELWDLHQENQVGQEDLQQGAQVKQGNLHQGIYADEGDMKNLLLGSQGAWETSSWKTRKAKENSPWKSGRSLLDSKGGPPLEKIENPPKCFGSPWKWGIHLDCPLSHDSWVSQGDWTKWCDRWLGTCTIKWCWLLAKSNKKGQLRQPWVYLGQSLAELGSHTHLYLLVLIRGDWTERAFLYLVGFLGGEAS